MVSFIGLLVPTLLLMLSLAEAEDNYTYVSREGKNDAHCINGGSQFPCHTLTYVANSISSSTPLTIRIKDPGLDINDNISFTGVSNVTLEGSPVVETVLKCNCTHCGMEFKDSQSITIKFLKFTGCGVQSVKGIRAALLVYMCYNFSVKNSSFFENTETGLSLIDTYGQVDIHSITMYSNGVCQNCNDSSGLLMEFTMSSNWGNYSIEDCHLRNNTDQKAHLYDDHSYGGGLSLRFTNCSANNSVSLRNVTLEENAATWGGGIFIQFCDLSSHNRVYLDKVTSRNNTAYKAGGGIDIGYVGSTSSPPITNIVSIENSHFIGNYARYGGGTGIYATTTTRGVEESHHNDNTLVFRSCNWEGNGARYFGSTVDVSPSAYDTLGSLYFPHPKFVNCTFHGSNTKERKLNNSSATSRLINLGAFAVYGFEVQFEEKVEFYDHMSTALCVTQGTVTFLSDTKALFQNNSGYHGGAMSLYGASSLWLYPNTTLKFLNNSASGRGGAIYHTTQNYHDFISSRTCFIKSYALSQQKKPQLIFNGNHATQRGKSIYATTFLPCYFEQFRDSWGLHNKVINALNKIADFNFSDHEALATSGIYFDFGKKQLSVIPGKSIQFPLNMTDELNNTSPTIFRVISDKNDKTCEADRQYFLDKITIKGEEKSECNLSLVSVGLRGSLLKTTVSVLKCPPGFHVENKSCICSAYSKNHAYNGISTCHDRRPFAYLKQGFWVGFDSDNESLLTAPCPLSFCVAKTEKYLPGIQLPNQSSSTALERVICQPHRTGWLCGRCQPNQTTYYHSPSYRCGSQEICVCGIFLYIFSEVLPIVVVFSVIAIFDIRFTTGTASGLVFFAQVIDTVSLTMKWNQELSKTINSLSILYKVVYGLFNFNFFNLEQASFCLWKNATVLDMIAFRYVSVAFAFILLLLLVLFLNYCTCYCSLLKNNKFQRNRSVIHSISAFLVMCYAQCTNVSFQILTKATLKGAGGVTKHDVTLFGGIHYFQKEHLMYAVAACSCLSTIVAIPPLLLLVYPGYATLFSFCKLNETRPLLFVSKMFMKLKPFLDSFQGCYRDKLRFFSGFYFVSRVVILAISAFASTTLQTIIIIEAILLLLLGAYTICNPFQKAKDNINNGLILLNMALIGCLTILANSHMYDDNQQIVIIALTMRLILLYLPIVCVCANVFKGAACWYIKKWKNEKDEIELDNLACEDKVIDHNYLPFQEVTVDSSEQAPEDQELPYREDILEYI